MNRRIETSISIYIIKANMKTIVVRQLDDRDEKIADALISLGMSRPAARILTYLQDIDEAKSTELEKGTGLRQPEISISMKQLKECDWINEREEKRAGKGRPYKVFSLRAGFNDIVAQLEEQHRNAAAEVQAKIERLKDITRS